MRICSENLRTRVPGVVLLWPLILALVSCANGASTSKESGKADEAEVDKDAGAADEEGGTDDDESDEDDLSVVPPAIVADAELICGTVGGDASSEEQVRFAALLSLEDKSAVDLTGYETKWSFMQGEETLEPKLLENDTGAALTQVFEIPERLFDGPFKVMMDATHPEGENVKLSWEFDPTVQLMSLDGSEPWTMDPPDTDSEVESYKEQ